MAKKFFGNTEFKGKVKVAETANRVPVVDGSNEITSSSVTSTELGYLSGVTSSLQTQLGNKVSTSALGAANGVAQLGADQKLLPAQLPAIAITDTFVVASQAAQEALTAQVGDVAVRTDLSKSFILQVEPASSFANWVELLSPDSPVQSVNGQTGTVTLTTTNISEGTNLYHTDERAQDAVGTILTDSSSIDFTYNDGTPSITAVVLPAGVDHDSLLNYDADQHIDHTTVSINTNANSGLSGGGDITASRSLVVDITGTTAETSIANNDEILIYDVSASARRKMTRANFLAGAVGTTGDIAHTSFSIADGQTTAADVTGFAFANGVVRSFSAIASVAIDATADLYEHFDIQGVQKGASWELTVQSTGDDSGVLFTITNAGQVQYTGLTYAGFVSGLLNFRAIVTLV